MEAARWLSPVGFQREPLSESGEGIVFSGTTVAVLVDELLDMEVESSVAADSRVAVGVDAGVDPGIPCCDCAPPEDVSDGGLDDDGGDGKREAPRVGSWLISTSRVFVFASDVGSSHSRLLCD